MSKASGVKAGEAYVDLSIKDRISKGLDRAKERLQRWAKGLAIVGGGLTGFAAGILTPLAAAVNHFSKIGSRLDDIAQMTGVSSSMLSALGYAAEQSGAGLEEVNKGLQAMARFTAQVANKGKGALTTLKSLGVDAGAFLAASPEKRLAMLADGLASIPDPGVRAALAMKVLGKAGVALLPLLNGGSAGLEELIKRAERLGLVVSPEDAKNAAAFGDAWDELKAVLSMIAFRVGAAVVEQLLNITDLVIAGAVAVNEFAENNRGLVVTVAAAAGVMMIAGGAVLGLAGASLVLSAVMGGLSTLIAIASGAWAFLGTVKAGVIALNTWLTATLTAETIAAFIATVQTYALSSAMGVLAAMTAAADAALAVLVSPLFLIVAGCVILAGVVLALGYAFLTMTSIGLQSIGAMAIGFASLLATALQTFGGIYDAIVGGRWDLAAEIAMQGINVAWQTGIYTLKTLWSGFKEWLVNLFAGMLASVLESFADFERRIVGMINSLRAKMRLPPIKGLELEKAAQGARVLEGMVKKGAAIVRKKENAEAYKPVAKAQKELTDLTNQAKTARTDKAQKRKDRLKGMLDFGMPDLGADKPAQASLGTFSASVAMLLGRSAPGDAAGRTADATEAMQEHLEAIRDKIEDGEGMVWE